MGKTVSDFNEIKIRGIDLDKKARLIKMADAQGKSLNRFLLEQLNRLAERHEVMETETKYSELVNMMGVIIEKNTKVMEECQEMIQVISGGEFHEHK